MTILFKGKQIWEFILNMALATKSWKQAAIQAQKDHKI